MKIGLIHNLYGQFSRGGAETVVAMMATDYISQGHEVFIITTKPSNAELTATANTKEKIFYLDSNYFNLARTSKLYRFGWHLLNTFSWRKSQKIKEILQTEQPDLVITHNLIGLGWLTPLIIRQQKIRHEHFLHDIQLLHPSGLMIWGQENIIDSLAAKKYQTLTRYFLGSPAKIISPSHWLLELHLKRNFFKNSITEIRPFAWPDDKSLSRSVENCRTFKDKINFLFIGQIEEQKGVLLLIKAFKNITFRDVRLIFAIRGGGQALDEAKKLAQTDKRIEFTGPLTFEEVEKIKATSNCLIVPSLCYENSPTVIYGAHASGLPVIAAAIGGIPEIVNENDRLFAPGNEEDLKAKIMDFINHCERL